MSHSIRTTFIGLCIVVGCQANQGTGEESASSPAAGAKGTTIVRPLVARGQEPGWMLRLVGDSIVYLGSYGTDTVLSVVEKVSTQGGVTTFSAASSSRLSVMVREQYCADGATGMPYPYAVTITHDTLTVHGCGGDPHALLAGPEWTVLDVAGTAMLQRPPTMTFTTEGQVSGTSSCNRYSAPFTITGEGLRFGPAILTKMACEPPLMSQETAFIGALGRTARFEVDSSGTLSLFSDDGQAIIARRQ